MTHQKLIGDTVAALVTEYRERRPRCPVRDYIFNGITERIGALDAGEYVLVDLLLSEASAPRQWDGTAWRSTTNTSVDAMQAARPPRMERTQ